MIPDGGPHSWKGSCQVLEDLRNSYYIKMTKPVQWEKLYNWFLCALGRWRYKTTNLVIERVLLEYNLLIFFFEKWINHNLLKKLTGENKIARTKKTTKTHTYGKLTN